MAVETLRHCLKGGQNKVDDCIMRQLLTNDEEVLLIKGIMRLTDRHIHASLALLNGIAMIVLASYEPPLDCELRQSWPARSIARYYKVRTCFGRQQDSERTIGEKS